MADAFHANHGFAYIVTPQGTEAFASSGSEEVFARGVAENWHERNPRMKRGLEHAHSGSLHQWTDWRLFSRDEIARDPFEQEFARRYDCMHYTGRFIPFAPGSFLAVSFERSEKKGAYDGSELRSVTASIEQARRSVAYALEAQAHLATSLVDTLSIAGPAHAWLEGGGILRHASPAFERLMGRYLGLRHGRLRALDGNDHHLQWLMKSAAGGLQVNDTVVLGDPTDPQDAALVRAVPLRVGAGGLSVSADILLSVEIRPPRTRTIESVLAGGYGLTRAEIRLALRLDEGMPLRLAADAENITYETARSRLKIVFHKLSVSRQADLMRRLAEIA